jgi:hypothetical protein
MARRFLNKKSAVEMHKSVTVKQLKTFGYFALRFKSGALVWLQGTQEVGSLSITHHRR